MSDILVFLCFILGFTSLLAIGYYIFYTPINVENKHSVKLKIKSIIRWELLNNKSFAEINYSNEDDVISLFYVCSDTSDKETLEEFRNKLTLDDVSKLVHGFERQTLILSQYQIKKVIEQSELKDTSNTSHSFLKDLIPSLILSGVDAHFALNEMEICDLPIYIEAHDKIKKDELESKRFWTFLLMKPNLSDKFKTPKDLMSFEWENETEDSISNEIEIEQAKNIFKNFSKKASK